MTRANFLGWLALLLVSLVPPARAQDSLYKRIGGYDAICAVSDDFLERLISNPQTGKYFVGAGTDTRQHIRQHVVDFLVENSGGPAIYKGRTMKLSHKGLSITAKEWQTSLNLLAESLRKCKVGKREADELTALIASLSDDIVEKK